MQFGNPLSTLTVAGPVTVNGAVTIPPVTGAVTIPPVTGAVTIPPVTGAVTIPPISHAVDVLLIPTAISNALNQSFTVLAVHNYLTVQVQLWSFISILGMKVSVVNTTTGFVSDQIYGNTVFNTQGTNFSVPIACNAGDTLTVNITMGTVQTGALLLILGVPVVLAPKVLGVRGMPLQVQPSAGLQGQTFGAIPANTSTAVLPAAPAGLCYRIMLWGGWYGSTTVGGIMLLSDASSFIDMIVIGASGVGTLSAGNKALGGLLSVGPLTIATQGTLGLNSFLRWDTVPLPYGGAGGYA